MREAGATVVGPCTTATEAFDVLRANEVDVAVVDFVLSDNNSEGLQVALETKGVPFVVLTGYPRVLVPRNDSQHVLSKPVSLELLSSAVKRLARIQFAEPLPGNLLFRVAGR